MRLANGRGDDVTQPHLASHVDLLRSSRFQVSQAPYDEILRFLIVEEREHVVSLLHELSTFGKPLENLWKRRIQNVLLDSIAEKTRDRLHDDLPTELGRSLVEMRNRPL